ncbi:macrophage mannose receptor 1-like [Mugil cephalus]|uniref:macrophage mannose receptor 1-like n=1 Tax=Mugil cephalus TaxID=48193 RepID=UPI001FB5E062|nr:macrophage mannose receptor 1-like [Mugil cephalus]
MDDVNVLNAAVDTSKMVYLYGYLAWIGLYDDVNSWRWSLSNGGFYSDGQTEFRNWADSQPNNEGSGEHCVEIDGDGAWSDADCTARLFPICSEVDGSNVTFVLISSTMTWTEAQSYCRTHHTDLASVRTMTENQRVKELLSPGIYWIGLFRDSWKWTDGRSSTFNYWRVGQPNGNQENCVFANFENSGKWDDWTCDKKIAFICYNAPFSKHVVKVKLVKKSSLDLNDPAVMEQMLQQMKQKLKDQGVSGDVKLSWRKQSDGKVFHKEEEESK